MGAEYATNIEDRARGYCFAAEMTVVKIAEGYRDKVALLPSTAGVFEEDGSIMGQGSQFWKAVGSSGMLTAKSESSDSNLPPLSCGGPACPELQLSSTAMPLTRWASQV
jgi:hypothetical protein